MRAGNVWIAEIDDCVMSLAPDGNLVERGDRRPAFTHETPLFTATHPWPCADSPLHRGWMAVAAFAAPHGRASDCSRSGGRARRRRRGGGGVNRVRKTCQLSHRRRPRRRRRAALQRSNAPGPVQKARSISSISSALSWKSPAPAFSRTWPRSAAFGIANRPGLRLRKRSATWCGVLPWRAAMSCRTRSPRYRRAASCRTAYSRPRRCLPRRRTAPGRARCHVRRDCRALGWRRCAGATAPAWRARRSATPKLLTPRKPNLAGRDEILHRAHGLTDRVATGPVQEIQVEVVGA